MNDNLKFWDDLRSGRFASMVKESSKGQRLNNSCEVYNVLKPLFMEIDDIEQAYFVFLDAKNKILSIEKLFSGTLTASAIYPREIVKRLIQLKASGFVMAHNHPTGSTQPSPEDQAITVKVGIAASAIDVNFHDHIIIGEGYYSMADAGWMKKVFEKYSEILKVDSIH